MSSLPVLDLELLFHAVPGAYLVLKPDFTIAEVSDNYLLLTNTKREDVLHKNLFKVFPDIEDDYYAGNKSCLTNLKASLNFVLEHGESQSMEIQKYDLENNEGVMEERYWSPFNKPILDAEKNVIYIIHQVEDVTSYKKAERRFNSFLEVMPDAAVLFDEKGVIKLVNNNFCSFFGYDKNEITGQQVKKILPDESIQLSKWDNKSYIDNIRQLNLNDTFTVLRKDETTFSAEIFFSPVHTDDGLLTAASIRDLSETKKVQARLSLLKQQVNQSNDGIYTVDINRKVTSWNKGAERIFGFTAEEAMGVDTLMLLQTKDGEEKLSAVLTTVSTQNYWSGELKRKRKDGTDIYVFTTITGVRNNANELTGFISVCIDISEQKRLQQQVNHLANIAEQSSEAIISRDLDKKIRSWNKGAEILFGYTRQEAIGKTSDDLGLCDFSDAELLDMDSKVMDTGIWRAEKMFFKKGHIGFMAGITANAVANEDGKIDSIVFVLKDINLRKKLEAQLVSANEQLEEKVKERTNEILENEKKYRILFESNPMPMWVVDQQHFKFLDVNNTAIYKYGYSKEEFLSMTLLNIRPEEERQAFIESDHSPVIDKNNYNRGTWKHRKKDGTILYAEITVQSVVYQGIPARLILANDVTEKKLAEERLKASEERYRQTLDNMIEGVQILDFDWKYIYLNEAAVKQAKVPKEELIGFSFLEKFPGVEYTELYKTFKRCFDERIPLHLENEFIYPDQSVAWYELSFQPVPEGVFVLSVDITKRKIAEDKVNEQRARLHAISNNLPGVLIYQFVNMPDGTAKFTYLSKEVLHLTGYTPDEALKDPFILDKIIIEEDRPLLIAAEKKALSELSIFNVEVRCHSASEGLRWINFISTPRLGENGQVIWDGFLIDITERKKIEQQIKQINAELEERVEHRTAQLKKSHEEMEAFSYSVSHDLRAPLRGIIGFSNILEEEYANKLDDEAKRITSIIKSNTVKMGALIDDLLAFSRVGRHQIDKSLINTGDLINQVIAGLDLKGKKDKIVWKISALHNAYGDLAAMRQVWINLLSNALKYSGNKPEQQIEIGSYELNNQVVFFVKDNGVGFDNKYVQKLFKVFQRLHSNIEFEGTGVGLAIVEKIISKHGGKVWASAVPNEGATFYFSLPCDQEVIK